MTRASCNIRLIQVLYCEYVSERKFCSYAKVAYATKLYENRKRLYIMENRPRLIKRLFAFLTCMRKGSHLNATVLEPTCK